MTASFLARVAGEGSAVVDLHGLLDLAEEQADRADRHPRYRQRLVRFVSLPAEMPPLVVTNEAGH